MRWRSRVPRPAVTIVVATYNRASMLPRALDCALEQDYPNLEVLVLDDGSTDDTPAVLETYARRFPPERFQARTHENIGQARTLNRGYALARGEIIGYLSDDDLLAPSLVTGLVELLESEPDAAAAYPAYHLIDGADAVIDTWLPLPYSPSTALSRHDTIIGPGGLARRRALEDGGAWDPSYHWMGDLIMWMGVGANGPVLRLDQPLASWRKHAENATSTTGVRRAAEHLRVFEHGLRLDPVTRASTELRAEALRNACVVAAFFAGHMLFGPGEPIYMIDLDRPLISAWSNGQAVGGNFDVQHAREVANRVRRLAELTMRLAEFRTSERAGGGFDTALKRLRAVGALTGEDAIPAALDEARFGEALIAAALDCALDVPLRQRRFLVPDREQAAAARPELEALAGLTMAGEARGRGVLDALAREISHREADLARAGIAPAPVD